MKKLQLAIFILSFISAPLYAAEFFCASGDVTCLIAAINEANLSSGPHTIFLEPGTYTLRTVDNFEGNQGANGLPAIRTNIAIRQNDQLATIERDVDRACFFGATAPFRLFYVLAGGTLRLYGLGLRYGIATNTRDGGGAILVSGGGTLIIERVAIYQNCTVDRDGTNMAPGGAIRANSIDSRVTILDSSGITLNSAQGRGGALATLGELEIIRSRIFENFAFDAAGAIAANEVTIRDSAVYSNGAINGVGGISANRVVLINGTVARNIGRSPGAGGGILALSAGITNSTISENQSALGGGGIHVIPGGTAALQNVILAGNLLAGGFPSDCQGFGRSFGNNIIGDTRNCSIELRETDIEGDPRLAEWSEWYFPLLSDSPAIDSANPDACPEFDQLGNPRVGICDRGAIEFQP